jgi:branched-chain amino acid transport system substrate-binding protein
VEQAGGKVLGSRVYPFPETTDFSAILVQAQASGANVLGLANSGADSINCIKQAREFGLTKTMRIAALALWNADMHAVGLDVAQGLVLTETYYWDLNDRTRAFECHSGRLLRGDTALPEDRGGHRCRGSQGGWRGHHVADEGHAD